MKTLAYYLRAQKERAARIKDALDILEAEGRKAFCETAEISRGTAIGHSLYTQCHNFEVYDAAIEALEENNNHLAVAALTEIRKDGKTVTRKGRTLTITLPKWWEEM